MPESQRKPYKKKVTVTTRPRSSVESSSSSSNDDASSTIALSLKSPRTARFAEATAVDSPIEPGQAARTPFAESLTTHYMAQAQPGDVGFGYLRPHHESVEMPKTPKNDYPVTPKSPLKSPLKSAMKTPGAPPRDVGVAVLTPAFHEEYLEKREKHAEKRQVKDLRIKTNVRMAKMMMRGVNFSCSLIVLAMLASTLTIFNATKDLPSRGGFGAWAPGQKIWPQVTVLAIACISLFMSIVVIWAYWKGGHKRAQKAATYYTAFSVAFFMFSIAMWAIGAGILQTSKHNNDGKDMWSWSCVKNTRSQLYSNDVPYDLLCRLQNWSLVCAIIEIVVEVITITVYGIVFYRFYSKHALRKSMAHRDRARSDLYLSQLRAQSAPNTPGFNGPYSARDGGWKPPMDYYANAPDIEDGTTQYVNADQKHQPAPFQLQPAPKTTGSTPKLEQGGLSPVTPKMEQMGMSPIRTTALERLTIPGEGGIVSPFMPEELQRETQQEHFAPAPGEPVYDFVPLPGAYEAPLASPGLEEQQQQQQYQHSNIGYAR